MVAHSDGPMTMSGTVAVITGGTTGIGAATRDLLRDRGARVLNLDIHRDGCPGDDFISCDVTDHESVSAAVGEVVNREGRIDCLFANAGIHRFATLEETSVQEFESVLSVNLKGVFYTLKAVIPVMKVQMHGSIFSGALGIRNNVWLAYGGGEFAPHAGLAEPKEQITIARRIEAQAGTPNYVPDQKGCSGGW